MDTSVSLFLGLGKKWVISIRLQLQGIKGKGPFIPFQPSVAFHIETSHLFSSAKQMTGFYMKRNTGQKWAKTF